MSNTLAITSDSSNPGGIPKDAFPSDDDLNKLTLTPWWQRMGQTRRGSLGFSDGIGSGTTPPANFYGTTPNSPMAGNPSHLPTVVEGRRSSFATASTLARSHNDDASINVDPSGRMFLEVEKIPQYHSGDIYDLAEGEIQRKSGYPSGERQEKIYHSGDIYDLAEGEIQRKAGYPSGERQEKTYHSGDIYDLAEGEISRKGKSINSGDDFEGDITRRVKSEALTGQVNIGRVRHPSGHIDIIETNRVTDVEENLTKWNHNRLEQPQYSDKVPLIEKDQEYATLALTPKRSLTPASSSLSHSRHNSGSPEPEEQLFEIEGTEDMMIPHKEPPKSLVSGLLSSVVNSWFFTNTDRDDEDEHDDKIDCDKYQYREGVQLVFNHEDGEDSRKQSLLNQVKHMVNEKPQRIREMNHWAPQNH